MPDFKYLGVSTKTATTFDSSGQVEYVDAFENVIQQIARALQIDGDGFMQRNIESNINNLTFQPADNVTAELGIYFFTKAISEQVKLVSRVSINYNIPDNQPNLIQYEILFTVKGSNAVGSMVYPFFLINENEG